jgi:predicted GNAT family N-acyltransferase
MQVPHKRSVTGHMEIIRTSTASDWDDFFRLAEDEGWRISPAERRLFQGPWADSARTLEADGCLSGFVTAVAHQRSGWIGNLIVPSSLRGRGYGRRLFTEAVTMLDEQRMESLWLTASEQGRPLYEQFGFNVIDQIERWVRKGSEPKGKETTTSPGNTLLSAADQAAWGEDREELLAVLATVGQTFADEDSVIFFQNTGDLQILGPWYSRNLHPTANRALLAQALAASHPKNRLVVDLIASSPLRPLLAEVGFTATGRSELMVRGERSSVQLSRMVSLASLGSVG